MARHALAVVGLSILESIHERGWNTALVSGHWLAVELGVDVKAARRALATCVELRWLRVVTKRPGGSVRYRLPAQLARAQGVVADDHTFAVDALATGTPPNDPVAELIAVAGHSAVGYDLGSKTWLAAVASQAGMPEQTLGVTKTRCAADQPMRRWMAAWPSVDDVTDVDEVQVVDVLDRHADRSGAAARKADAEKARRVAAETRRAETEKHRAIKTAVYKALARLLDAHPLPDPTKSKDTQVDWGHALAATITANDLPEEVRVVLARAIEGRMKRVGYKPESAQAVSRFVCGLAQREVAA